MEIHYLQITSSFNKIIMLSKKIINKFQIQRRHQILFNNCHQSKINDRIKEIIVLRNIINYLFQQEILTRWVCFNDPAWESSGWGGVGG